VRPYPFRPRHHHGPPPPWDDPRVMPPCDEPPCDAPPCGPPRRRPPWAHGPWQRMTPLFWYVRAHLHRRLFVWFVVTMVATVLAVGGMLHLTSDGNASWKRETQRVTAFMGGRFERVWASPADRAELALAMSRDLDATVTIEDAARGSVMTFGAPCTGHTTRLPVRHAGAVLGHVSLCAQRFRPQAWKLGLALLVTALVIWLAAAKIARRLAKPMGELARVAEALGAGNFGARVELEDRHRFGETAALAMTMNTMAARIQRQLTEQRELLASVSHEMRTPLARIRILTEMARDQGASDKTLDDLDREVMEMDALVGDLLASSRMDFAALSKRPLDAVEAASRALERSGADPAALVVERERGASGDPIRIEADATLLGRLLGNLIDNAKKHGGGVDALKVKRENGHVAFEVEDQGEGFAPGEDARVFEPFYRRGENGSLGLGLALVKRIAEAHGGRAYAENRGGGGARVGVELPAIAEA
jgi:two-component system, OmpR family, sensor kinase